MITLLARTSRCLFAVGIALLSASAHADIIGFHDYTINRGDSGSPPVLINADTIQLTTGNGQKRSLWFNVPQDISEFTASFTYRVDGIAASASLQGLSFVMQNDPDGVGALGATAPGGVTGLGFLGIAPSAAVTIELQTGSARTFTSFQEDGVYGGGAAPVFPVNAFDGQEIDVILTYKGNQLSVEMSDGVNDFPARNHIVGFLPDAVGGSTAYVGFTAGTVNGANQYISNFQFVVPEPATVWLAVMGGLALIANRVVNRRGTANGQPQ